MWINFIIYFIYTIFFTIKYIISGYIYKFCINKSCSISNIFSAFSIDFHSHFLIIFSFINICISSTMEYYL